MAHVDRMRRLGSHACLAFLGLGAPASTLAESPWIFSFSAPVELQHDSNPLMSVTAPVSVRRVRTVPEGRARYRSGQQEVELNAGAAVERSDKPAVIADRNDPRVRADWRRFTPRSTFAAFGQYEQSAFRSLQVEERVPLSVDGTRRLAAAGASYSHELSQATSVSVDGRQEAVKFDIAGLSDYRLTAASTQYQRALDERSSWFLAINGQRYRREANGAGATESTSRGFLAGYRVAVSEALQLESSFGQVRMTGAFSKTGWQGNARIAYSGSLAQLTFEAARRASPSAITAGLTDVTALRLTARYLLDERTFLDLEIARSTSRAQASSTASTAALAWTRHLSPSWQLALKAQEREREEPTGGARAHVLGVALTYSAPDL